MSSGLYSHTTRATGTVLTATIYNGDHVNHITNQNPLMTGAYSDNVSQMQLATDPGAVGSESLAGTLGGELERLRFAIKRLAGGAQWYSAPVIIAAPLFGTSGATDAHFGTNGGTDWEILQATRAWVPATDGTLNLGAVANRIAVLFTKDVDSGTTASLLLGTGNGNTGIEILDYTVPAAATAALAGAGAGNIDNGTHSWKVTFVVGSAETAPGAVSNQINVTDKTTNGQVALSAVPTGPAGTTKRKIYRTVAGDTGSYKLVGSIADNVTTTFTDNIADASLGVVAPSGAFHVTVVGGPTPTIDVSGGGLTVNPNVTFNGNLTVLGSLTSKPPFLQAQYFPFF